MLGKTVSSQGLFFNLLPSNTNLQPLRTRRTCKLGIGSIQIPLVRRRAIWPVGVACMRVPCTSVPGRHFGAGQSRLSPPWGFAGGAELAGTSLDQLAAGADSCPHRVLLCPLSKPGISCPARSLAAERDVVCEGPRKANKNNLINST